MGDAPRPASTRARVELIEITGLGHRRIGDRPDERGSREICGDQHDAIGQDHNRQPVRGSEIRDAGRPARARPGDHQHQRSQTTEHQACRNGRGGTQPGELGSRGPGRKRPFCEVPQPFATGRVAGLDGQRAQRPEAAFGEPKQSAAPEPTEGDNDREEQEADHGVRGHHSP